MIPVAFDLRDPLRSGIARVARSLARAFAATAGDRFSIVFAGPPRALEALDVRAWGAPNARVVRWESPRYSPRAEVDFARVRRETGDALWYFPHWDVPWFSAPPRFIATLHDLNHVLHPGGLSLSRRFLARRWIGRTATKAARLTVVSRFTGEELGRLWPELSGKVSVIRNGVDASFFLPAPPLPAQVAERLGTDRYMFSLGIRKEHKNLAVGPRVLARIPGLKWVVVGEWFPEWEHVHRLAQQLGVRDRMIVVDSLPDADVRALYAGSACLFFPSRQEGFGIPILEAFAAGRPVVASTSGASAETAGGLATLCTPDDASAFAAAVERALSDSGADAERRRAHAATFSWDTGAAKLAQLFTELAQ